MAKTPQPFAKIFESPKYGQLLMRLDISDDGDHQLAFIIDVQDLGWPQIALTFDREDKAREAFEKVDLLCAEKIVGRSLDQFLP